MPTSPQVVSKYSKRGIRLIGAFVSAGFPKTAEIQDELDNGLAKEIEKAARKVVEDWYRAKI